MNIVATRGRRTVLTALVCLTIAGCGAVQDTAPVDLLITGGRVMDPDSGLDAVLNVAVRGGVIVEMTLLKRPSQVEDVSSAAVFLASDSKNYMTGQTISPNGGGYFTR